MGTVFLLKKKKNNRATALLEMSKEIRSDTDQGSA